MSEKGWFCEVDVEMVNQIDRHLSTNPWPLGLGVGSDF